MTGSSIDGGARPPLRRRWRVLLGAGVLVVLIARCGGKPDRGGAPDRAATLGTPARSAPATPTADAATSARAKARDLTRQEKYAAAVAAYESTGLDVDANRVRRAGARALYRSSPTRSVARTGSDHALNGAVWRLREMYSFCGNSRLSLTVAPRDRPERASGIGQRVDRGEGRAPRRTSGHATRPARSRSSAAR
jgi:hypothetical protein